MPKIYGTSEGAAAMAGMSLGAAGGIVVGAVGALWLVLRRGGEHAIVAVLGLWGAAVLAIVAFGVIAFD
jgi:hypothetical protein